jgi:hypothetical protein
LDFKVMGQLILKKPETVERGREKERERERERK